MKGHSNELFIIAAYKVHQKQSRPIVMQVSDAEVIKMRARSLRLK